MHTLGTASMFGSTPKPTTLVNQISNASPHSEGRIIQKDTTMHYEVIETDTGYEVAIVKNDRIIQIVLRTDNRQKAYRLVEKGNGKARNTERSNKNTIRNI